MVTYELELNEGDTCNVGMQLKQAGVAVDLTGSTSVTFTMKNETGTEFSIPCAPGGTVNGTAYTFAQGGITVSFTATHTANPGIFQGKVTVIHAGAQKTFPSGNVYITVKIWEEI